MDNNVKPVVFERFLFTSTHISGDPKFDLRRETAFNVSLIYQSSGADDLARMYVDKYIVI